MEILTFKLLVTEEDLNLAATRYIPDDEEVTRVRARIAPEGVYVTGIYHMMIKVPFETRWEVTAAQGVLSARLADFKAMGMPAMLFQGVLMKLVRETVEKENEVIIEKDTIRLSLERLLAKFGFRLRTHLNSVCCQQGLMTFEAIPSAA